VLMQLTAETLVGGQAEHMPTIAAALLTHGMIQCAPAPRTEYRRDARHRCLLERICQLAQGTRKESEIL